MFKQFKRYFNKINKNIKYLIISTFISISFLKVLIFPLILLFEFCGFLITLLSIFDIFVGNLAFKFYYIQMHF